MTDAPGRVYARIKKISRGGLLHIRQQIRQETATPTHDFRPSQVYNACGNRSRKIGSWSLKQDGARLVPYAQCNDKTVFSAWRREAPEDCRTI